MGDLVLTTIIPVITAIISVFLTLWFREKTKTVNSLRAVQTELRHNDDLGESMLHDLFSNRDSETGLGDLLARDSVPLQTSAYEHLVNSGTAVKIDDELEDSIWYHYLVIRKINGYLSRRHEFMDKIDVERADDEILDGILYLSDYDRLDVMEANLQNNNEALNEIKNVKDRQQKLEDSDWDDGNITKHTFLSIAHMIDEAIYVQHWLPTIIARVVL